MIRRQRHDGRRASAGQARSPGQPLAGPARFPRAEFDLTPNLFTARVPGRDEPFVSMTLCKLMDTVERWAAEELMAGLLTGAGPADHPDGQP
jgi:hypothetical protein